MTDPTQTPSRRRAASPRAARAALAGALLALATARGSAAQDPFADAVAVLTPGTNGGFGSDLLPGIVLGPPRGAGDLQGSFDVLALGIGGSIVLRFDPPVICDAPGPDFTVFENVFHTGSPSGPLFTEFAYVAVSQDGEHFVEYPFDAATGVGLAGRTPVYSSPDNDITPLDPALSGGDAFDLADVGLAWAAYVRITDVGGAIRDVGDLPQFTVAPNAGFDLDAIAALHACDPSALPSPTPTASPTAMEPDTPTPTPTITTTPLPVADTPTATPPPALAGDLDGDGVVGAADRDWLTAEIFDGDGDAAAAAAGGAIASGPAADVNGDGRITAADVAALQALP